MVKPETLGQHVKSMTPLPNPNLVLPSNFLPRVSDDLGVQGFASLPGLPRTSVLFLLSEIANA